MPRRRWPRWPRPSRARGRSGRGRHGHRPRRRRGRSGAARSRCATGPPRPGPRPATAAPGPGRPRGRRSPGRTARCRARWRALRQSLLLLHPAADLLLEAVRRGLVVTTPDHVVGGVLLIQPPSGIVMRVLVALSVAEHLRTAVVGVAQMRGHGAADAIADVLARLPHPEGGPV